MVGHRFDDGQAIKVERIISAVYASVPANPDVIAAQIERSIGFALSTVFRNQITLRDGVVQQKQLR
jgi:isoquinoline 1-oxidoreductase beta subunit